MYSCHGVFTDQVIFRTILARIEKIFLVLQTIGIFAVLMTFTFTFPRISYTLNALIDGVELPFCRKKCSKFI